jgi:hypothetical protein
VNCAQLTYISSIYTKLKQIYRSSTQFSRDVGSMSKVWTKKEDIRSITKIAPSVVRQMLIFNTLCWGPSASEGHQKHDLTVFLEYNV